MEKYKRYEFKYILNPVQAIQVREYVRAINLIPDIHSGFGGYFVTSLYFDSIGLEDYYDKAGGYLMRKKVRARIYGYDLSDNQTEVHLEIKKKHDMFVAKERKVISVREWRAFIQGDMEAVFDTFRVRTIAEGRRSTAVVRYKREAYEEFLFDKVRLTLDSNIEYVDGAEYGYEKSVLYDTIPVSGDMTVMEIKFSGALPWWFGHMVRMFNLKRTAYSKYAESVNKAFRYTPLAR